MNLHEYQTKQLLSDYAVDVPPGRPAASAEEARAAAQALGSGPWVVKAQIHAGARGAAGGVVAVATPAAAADAARTLLGRRLVTQQTGPAGLPVERVLVEAACEPRRELYLAMTVDRTRRRVIFMVSGTGGVDVEALAAADAGRILTVAVDPVVGLQPYQCRRMGYHLDIPPAQLDAFGALAGRLYRLFVDKDLGLLEINPLVITAQGALMALDAKVVVDDNALYRQPALARERDWSQEDDMERRAHGHGLNYITLDGDIACMVNGAGLAMATMDLIKLHGGRPANFLDVGGGTTAERVAAAFKLIMSDPKVKAVLVNIFGGIVRCDLIAEGVLAAVRDVGVRLPVVVRLEGTNAAQGRALLRGAGLAVIAADSLTDAAQKAVAAAR